ncbi:MAG: polysaccharide deacetylase family protein [bacterium]|nr:polysaccharide deacetylase family protein [bacterium]
MFIIRTIVTVIVSGAIAAGSILSPPDKYIALTFDDGPRPEVLLGENGLLDVLDGHSAKATFFFMGWLLADEKGSAYAAAKDAHQRGHEIENHTYGHGAFRAMSDRYGEEWIFNDIEKASARIEALTGRRPTIVRPPEWSIWEDMRMKLEARGYRVATKSTTGVFEPLITEDVDTEDYHLYEEPLDEAAKQKRLYDLVLQKIERRERRGAYGHILVFHELSMSREAMVALIPELRKKGYGFVTLDDYLKTLESARLRTPSRYVGDMLRAWLWK